MARNTFIKDATEMLEKRVKSRCFHKKIYLFFDYTFEDYMKIFKSLVSLPRDFGDKRFLANWKDRVEVSHYRVFLAFSLKSASMQKLSKNEEALEVLKQMHKLMPGIHQLKLLLVSIIIISLDEPHQQPLCS